MPTKKHASVLEVLFMGSLVTIRTHELGADKVYLKTSDTAYSTLQCCFDVIPNWIYLIREIESGCKIPRHTPIGTRSVVISIHSGEGCDGLGNGSSENRSRVSHLPLILREHVNQK